MRPPSPQSTSAHRLQTRLHHWRLRQHYLHAPLFPSSLSPPNSKSPLISLHKLRTGQSQLLVSSTPILICDACANLVSLPSPTCSSSASTLSPSAHSDDSFACPCGFVTPTGILRRLLGLPDDRGPAFDNPIARALLIEAIGAPAVVNVTDRELREWVLDNGCRIDGLLRLCQVLGLCEEEVGPIGQWHSSDSEGFFERFPNQVMVPVPFALTDLEVCDITNVPREDDLREAVAKAKSIVTNAITLMKGELGFDQIQKLRKLGDEYMTERRTARIYALGRITTRGPISDTQSKLQSSARGKDSK